MPRSLTLTASLRAMSDTFRPAFRRSAVAVFAPLATPDGRAGRAPVLLSTPGTADRIGLALARLVVGRLLG